MSRSVGCFGTTNVARRESEIVDLREHWLVSRAVIGVGLFSHHIGILVPTIGRWQSISLLSITNTDNVMVSVWQSFGTCRG
jgi:hypothetical protein